MSTHRPPNWPRQEHPYSRAPQRIEPVFIELARFNRGPRHDPEAEIMRISIDAFTPPDAPQHTASVRDPPPVVPRGGRLVPPNQGRRDDSRE